MALCGLPEFTLLLLPLLARLSAGDCPCSEAALCQPIRHRPDFEASTLASTSSRSMQPPV
uniref:Chitobiase n=1 Tax=Mus musculus TaxID=10090 RepID=A0A0G2JDI3_MOUSE